MEGQDEFNNVPEGNITIEQKESIKLTKNTKGYGWEIKQLSLDIDALEKINNTMKLKFGGDAQ
jgi:hypothetical protein